MNQQNDDIVMRLIDEVSGFRQIESNLIPNIDLYMDQVTTFFDDSFAHLKRDEDDKILTKTMINNYIKDGVLPPPIKKKYTKEHMMLFSFTYTLKQILSVNDIKTVLKPVVNEMGQEESKINIEALYDGFLSAQKQAYEKLADDMRQGYQTLQKAIDDGGRDEIKKHVQLSYVALLVSNASAMKYVAQKIIDDCLTQNTESKE